MTSSVSILSQTTLAKKAAEPSTYPYWVWFGSAGRTWDPIRHEPLSNFSWRCAHSTVAHYSRCAGTGMILRSTLQWSRTSSLVSSAHTMRSQRARVLGVWSWCCRVWYRTRKLMTVSHCLPNINALKWHCELERLWCSGLISLIVSRLSSWGP